MKWFNRRILRLVILGSCGAWLAPSAGAQSLLYEESGRPGFGSYYGSRVAAAGDLDGDGKRDFLFADYISSSGYVQAFSGADGTILHGWIGSIGTDHLGIGMTGDIDVDGDGLSDVVISKSNYPTGALFAYSGITGAQLWTVSLQNPSDAISISDRDSDGRRDVAVLHDSGSSPMLDILSGATGALLWQGPAVGAFGLANAGDVDGDGFEDLAITSYSAVSRVLSGLTGAVLFTIPDVPDALGGTGDVDGDGFDDVVAGGYLDGSVRVYGGPDGHLIHNIDNPDAGSSDGYYWGVAVCAAGDADLDGYDDIAVRSGSIGIYVFSGKDGRKLSLFEDVSAWGWCIAAGGDINGDGFPDILSGNEQGGTMPGGGPGYAQVISPCPLPPQTYCASLPNSTGVAARIGSLGTASLSAKDLRLTVTGGVPYQPALFFYGPERIEAPFGHGLRCVAGGAFGTFRLGPPQAFDVAGNLVRPLPIAVGSGDATAGDITVGLHWNFQLWYRDPAAGGSAFNLSDALSVTPCP